ncbi:MAG: twin-arginine translocation signal domain-containing protein [Chloroflexales bacterium]|nr:twin-arginine translocation signal domain-containing protein [Chloroflexales bacterium]
MNRRTFLKHTGVVCGTLAAGALAGPMSAAAYNAAPSEQPDDPRQRLELETWLLATGVPYLDAQIADVATQELVKIQTQ